MKIKRKYKYLAFILIFSLIIPFFPSAHVFAVGGSPFPFDYPSTDSFYPVDFVIRLFNCGDAYYLRVRTDNGLKIRYWRYLEQYTIPVTADPFTKYTFYDDLGNVVNNPFDTNQDNNLLLFRNIDEDLTGVTPFGIVQASNANLYAFDEGVELYEGETFIYFYQNYVSLAVTPTPTPEPQPVIKDWFDYPELPSNFSADTKCILKTHSDGINDGQLIGIAFTATGSAAFNYPNFYKSRQPYGYNSQASIQNAITINSWSNNWHFSVFSVNYNEATDTYSVGGNLKSGISSPGVDSWFTSVVFDWRGETVCSWSLVPDNSLTVTGQQAGTYANSPQNWFEILFTNHNYVPSTSDTPNISPTPTTNPTPTLRPQPTTNPDSTPTPTPDVTIVQPSNHWWDGLVKPLQYIFIPSTDKMMNTYNTFANKFGVQKPTKFEFDANSLLRPNNVVFNFKHVSLDGNNNTVTQVVLIDFVKVDEWLETSAGQMSIRIIRAVFTLLMWGYLIYIFQKHVATINYTDANTLIEQSRKGGDDE